MAYVWRIWGFERFRVLLVLSPISVRKSTRTAAVGEARNMDPTQNDAFPHFCPEAQNHAPL